MTNTDIPSVIAASPRWAPIAALTDRFFDVPVWKALVQHVPTTEAEILPYLASEMGIDDTAAWHNAKTDKQRRHLIDDAYERHRTRGTNAGLKRAARDAGGEVRRIIAPPNKFFLSSNYSVAERNAWLARMPEIRMYPRREPGTRGSRSFAGSMFPGAGCFLIESDAIVRSRLKVTLVKNGVETPLETYDWDIASVEKPVTTTIKTPGTRGSRSFAGSMFPGAGCFTLESDAVQRYMVLRDVAHYTEKQATLSLRTVQPSLEPIDTDGEMVSEIHTPSPVQFFAGGIMNCTVQSRAYLYNYRRIKLHDPDAPVTRARALSHLGVTRLGMPPHTARVEVAFFGRRNPLWSRFAGLPFVASDHSNLDELLANLRLAKRKSDSITISTKIYRPLLAGRQVIAGPDIIAGGTTRK